jgi:hypothetical protein
MKLNATAARIGLAAAIVTAFTLAQGASTHAQGTPPATYFGAGLTEGDSVEAFIGSQSCGSTTVTPAGEWVIVVAVDAPCSPVSGAAVSFTVNGSTAEEQLTWEPGGSPPNLATGLALTVGAAPPKPPAPAEGAIVGDLPAKGLGLVTFGGTLDGLRTALAASCPSGAPVFATSGGSFVGFFPTAALSAPNKAFEALYGAGIASNTPLLGGNCG